MKQSDYNSCLLYLLYLSKSNMIFLELKIDEYPSVQEVPSGLYEEILLETDKYYKIHNKLSKYFASESNVDKHLKMFEKQVGKA